MLKRNGILDQSFQSKISNLGYSKIKSPKKDKKTVIPQKLWLLLVKLQLCSFNYLNRLTSLLLKI